MWILAVLSLVFAYAQTTEPATGWQARTLEYDGLTRTYSVYVPATADDPAPLVIALHPAGASGRDMALISRFNELADPSGWLVAYPDGPGGYWDYGAGTPEWEDVPDLRDDPGFIAAMIEAIDAEWMVDRERIYAAGYSNGARMAHRLACELPLAGVAMAAATLSDEVTKSCKDGIVAVWMQHGTADSVVPFDGDPDLTIGSLRISRALSVIETAQFYALRNGCDNPTFDTVFEFNEVVRVRLDLVRYQDCAQGSAVEVLVADGGGHGWTHVPTVDTSALIWGFFEQHTLIVPAAEE
ncbi:MAG: hypothetical protein IPK52_18765 [Chloroflexi bacterium]|nr:hypothetical protein [Chloroflexota bacterium]